MITMEDNMKNHTKVEFNDECPKHETALKKEYSFGGHGDSCIYVFDGCNCAEAPEWRPLGYEYR